MKLSVVVPAYNEAALITDTLESIQQAAAPLIADGLGLELLVVDNACTDETARLAAAAGAVVVEEPQRQIARARNAGAAAATGDWLVFVDADSRPTPGLFKEVEECIRAGNVAAGGSTVRMRTGTLGGALAVNLWNVISRHVGWAAGSFIFCRADAFRDVGGFDLEYYIAEELVLSNALKAWARRHNLGFTILSNYPLETSGRKTELYSAREIASIFWGMLRHGRRYFRDPTLCYPWYDGRR